MQLHTGSKHLAADIAVALDVSGREHLVIMAKATWSIPEPGQRPRPLPPVPLVPADQFYGEPGESALRYGSDFARFKPRCDVLFDACAHTPEGKPANQMEVEVQVGAMRKCLRVYGARRWRRIPGLTEMGDPESFTTMPLHFGMAFGGTRWYEEAGQKLCEALPANPAGLGYAGRMTDGQVHGELAPNLEDPQHAVKQPGDNCKPVALSAIARHWSPRQELAGSHDEAWQRDVFPFLPENFDEGFNQVAPLDQQIPYPTGREVVRLQGLMPTRPQISFHPPRLDLGVRVLRTDYSKALPQAVVDTLFFEPEEQRFSAVWRASLPIRRKIQEFSDITIGPVDESWWAAKASGALDGGCIGCRPSSAAVRENEEEHE